MVMPRSATFHSIATRLSVGLICLSSSIRLGVSSADTSEMPVMLPPGRAKPSTKPVATGSPVAKATTGSALFCLAANAGVRIVPLWRTDEAGLDIAVERLEAEAR